MSANGSPQRADQKPGKKKRLIASSFMENVLTKDADGSVNELADLRKTGWRAFIGKALKGKFVVADTRVTLISYFDR